MTKHTHIKITPTQILLSIISIGIVFTGFLFVVYQMKYGNFSLISHASDPCSAYTKLRSFSETSGVVQSKQEGQFIWNMNGNPATAKVVVLCGGTRITPKLGFGGALTYADIHVGDTVSLTGRYGGVKGMQPSDTTILPSWIRVTPVSSQIKELTATVASVNVPDSSFVLYAVDGTINGKRAQFNLTVRYSTETKCSIGSNVRTVRTMSCSKVSVGQSATVTGSYYNDVTLMATRVEVR